MEFQIIQERIEKVYNDLSNILKENNIFVDNPMHATNPKKIGNVGMRCSTVVDKNNTDLEAWISIRPNFDCIDIIPPMYKFETREYFWNGSYNKKLCKIINDVVHDYVKNNMNYLFNDNEVYCNNMKEMLSKYNNVLDKISKYKNIELLRTEFYKNYIELRIVEKSILNGNIFYDDFSIIISKSKRIAKKRTVNHTIETPSNIEDIYIIRKKHNFKRVA